MWDLHFFKFCERVGNTNEMKKIISTTQFEVLLNTGSLEFAELEENVVDREIINLVAKIWCSIYPYDMGVQH